MNGPRGSLQRTPLPVAAGLALLAATGLSAQDTIEAEGPRNGGDLVLTTGGYDHSDAPRVLAVPLSGPISVDGFLDEAAWAAAPAITDFRQTLPLEGQPVTEATDVRILYDDDAVYIGARLDDRSAVTTRLARRDSGLGDSDVFIVLLDSFHDHETAYRFWTNPSGVKGDAIVTGNSTGGGDSSWDPVWEVVTRISDDGWSAEMRIPFSQLRFSPDEEQVWGVQVERTINRNQERATFPFTPTLERAGVSRFAHLEGIRGIEPGRRLELLPYVVARGEYLQLDAPGGIDFDNPYRSGSDHFADIGMDLKYRITSNVTLDATVNPDFGQVELDPSVINLTAFETRFQERRPFFVEGADIFSFGEAGPTGSVGRGPEIVYSRRIGTAPRGSAPSGSAYSDVPSATTILGAAKVTGRFGSGWSLGVLEAVTAKETAEYMNVGGGRGEVVVEPAANYLVARLRRQISGGQTRFGAIASAVNRDPSGTGLEGELHSSAYAAGVDFAHESSDRTWLFTGLVSGATVRGSAEAITATQRASRRYFQRPDAEHVALDPQATSMDGLYLMGYVGKQAGNFTMRNGFAYISPGYEANDLGFHTNADRILFDTHYQWTDPEPGRYFRSWSVSGSPDAVWNSAGDRTFANFNTQLSLEFLNYWRTSIRLQFDPWTEDDRLTRGGPMARTPGAFDARINLNSDGRRPLVFGGNVNWGFDDGESWNRGVSGNVTWRFDETLQFRVQPSYSRAYSEAQYVQRVSDPLAVETFGSRYVFAGLDRTTLSLDTTLNVTFSPTLSLQLYVEPFISTGRYEPPKQFRAPNTFEFLEYGSDLGTLTRTEDGGWDVDPDGEGEASSFHVRNRDFSYRSLLGNAVLRWEWRPGSTLYLVWQQRRINSLTGYGAGEWVGDFDIGRDTGDMFSVAPDNVLMIKVNYWLNP